MKWRHTLDLTAFLLFTPLAFGIQARVSQAADTSLHYRIDSLLTESLSGEELAEKSDDAEFIRRVYLDLVGRIPDVDETRSFLADAKTDKRQRTVDHLLASPEHARRMHELFHVILMERRADDAHWDDYLRRSFLANRHWNKMVVDFLSPKSEASDGQGAAFFLTSRLTKEGAMAPVDVPGLTRDVGRLLAGVDLQCAQCHDHISIGDYSQRDFQGLHLIFENIETRRDVKFPAVAEKLVSQPKEYVSVFTQVTATTGVVVPGGPAIDIVKYEEGDEYLVPPDKKKRLPGIPKFSPLTELATQLATAENRYFARNIANRLWFVMMGRGLVEPLDLHHSDNPASHPELLELLANDLAQHDFDLRYFIRELALTDVYQRSSVRTEDTSKERYAVAFEKRLSAEQLFWSVMVATNELGRVRREIASDVKESETPTSAEAVDSKAADGVDQSPPPALLTEDEQLVNEQESLTELRKRFVKTFANPPKEAEVDFQPTVKAALFLMHDESVLKLLRNRAGNSLEKMSKIKSDEKLVEELFLRFLSRPATPDDLSDMKHHLAHSTDRDSAIWEIAWALMASTEFCVNH